MGLWISKLWSLFGDQEARILVLGLDNAGKASIDVTPMSRSSVLLFQQPLSSPALICDHAGKTTILYRLQVGEVVSTIPTIGFNVETVTYKNIKFQVWDLGGQTSIRPYWRCYFPCTQVCPLLVCVHSMWLKLGHGQRVRQPLPGK